MKWYGEIGYAVTEEKAPGIWEEVISTHAHYGDIVHNSRRLSAGDGINDNIVINNQLSIVADPYALENFCSMRYAEFMGTKWKITNVEVEYPRLTLTLGGVWNEE